MLLTRDDLDDADLIERRFRVKVRAQGACLVWIGARIQGYGVMRVRIHGQAHNMRAHRVAWLLAGHTLDTDLKILHRCNDGSGNHGCVTVEHLYQGTQQDNATDQIRAGRHLGKKKGVVRWPAGTTHTQQQTTRHSVLTPDDVKAIQDAYAAGGISQRALADRYGVHQHMIWRIVRRIGKTYEQHS